MNSDVDISSKLDAIEQKSTTFSEVATELDVRNCLLSYILRCCLIRN